MQLKLFVITLGVIIDYEVRSSAFNMEFQWPCGEFAISDHYIRRIFGFGRFLLRFFSFHGNFERFSGF